MIVAFLFDSNAPKFRGNYGGPICKLILSTDVLQQSGRHLKISSGDVPILSIAKPKKRQEIIPFCEQTYFGLPWNFVLAEKIRAIYLKSTIFAWVIQNITEEISIALHSILKNDSAYLGMHEVDYSYPIHFDLYRNGMVPMYRIQGRKCNIFYSIIYDGDDRNYDGFNIFEDFGFEVEWEDVGIRWEGLDMRWQGIDTYFELRNTRKHYEDINNFVDVITPYFDGERDEAEELAMLLDDWNPYLFDVLGAAARSFKQAKNEEDFAQIGVSGRRYLEQFADVVYPASNEKHNGRDVTKRKYKNRIWAFIESLPISEPQILCLGGEVDRLSEIFNKILHRDPNSDMIKRANSTNFSNNEIVEDTNLSILIGQALGDVAKLTLNLLSVAPKNTHKPYFPYDMTEDDLIFPDF